VKIKEQLELHGMHFHARLNPVERIFGIVQPVDGLMEEQPLGEAIPVKSQPSG